MTFEHTSVLRDEAISYLNIQKNKTYVDATLGRGGHASVILEKNSPKGLLVGFDRDKAAILAAKENLEEFGSRVIYINKPFSHLKEQLYAHDISQVSGILFDLGLSSYQLSDETRGFSFQGSAALDMQMGSNDKTAAEVVNTYEREEIERILKEYGEERYAKEISRKIEAFREEQPLERTDQLVGIIEDVYSNKPRPKKHPATKTFQAIRIEVNNELEHIEKALEQALEVLEPGGRIVVISFHSLEDRIVKQFFKQHVIKGKFNKYGDNVRAGRLKILTKKPLLPSEEEVRANPRARSAKMRAAEIIK